MKILQITILAAGLAGATGAHAGDRILLAGGEAGDTDYYSYVGLALPLGSRQDGRGFVQRYWLDRFGYEYDSGSTRIEADAYGAEAAVGYVWSSPRGWSEASVGARYTDTDLDPDDPSAEARGSQLGAKVQFQGEWSVAAPWRVGLIASWANQQSAYWSRARLMRQVAPRTALGAEVVAGGNDESRSTAAGAAMTLRPGETDWSIGLHAGYRWQEESDSIYAGIELGYSF